MRALIVALLLAMVGPSLAAEIVVTDGDTFQVGRTIYRLNGIDAPEIDQTCIDKRGDVWPCGVMARARGAVILLGIFRVAPRARPL